MDYQNHYKNIIFKKDLFSDYKIKYKKINNNEVIKIFRKITLSKSRNINVFIPKINTATNSVNFIIHCGKKKFYLKRESEKKEKLIEKENRFKALRKLKENNLLILPIKKYRKFLKSNQDIWTIYEYFDGEHFSGKKNQIKNVSKFISKISIMFEKLSFEEKSFKYFLPKENKIINYYMKDLNLRKNILNGRNEKIFFNYFFTEWERLKQIKKKFKNLKKTFCHFDMHPHNIMFKNNKIKIIDLASIKFMPLEIAIAFSGLKLCRQTIYNNKFKNYKEVGLKFVNSLNSNLTTKLDKNLNVSDLASVEIMRRICIILTYNYFNDRSLNFILPVLMSNLIEAKLIFNKIKF